MRQLVFHFSHVEKRDFGIGTERHEKIDVTVRTKIFSQSRAEQLQLGHSPTRAERFQLISWNFNLSCTHNTTHT